MPTMKQLVISDGGSLAIAEIGVIEALMAFMLGMVIGHAVGRCSGGTDGPGTVVAPPARNQGQRPATGDAAGLQDGRSAQQEDEVHEVERSQDAPLALAGQDSEDGGLQAARRQCRALLTTKSQLLRLVLLQGACP